MIFCSAAEVCSKLSSPPALSYYAVVARIFTGTWKEKKRREDELWVSFSPPLFCESRAGPGLPWSCNFVTLIASRHDLPREECLRFHRFVTRKIG